jgi:hypothetical protein
MKRFLLLAVAISACAGCTPVPDRYIFTVPLYQISGTTNAAPVPVGSAWGLLTVAPGSSPNVATTITSLAVYPTVYTTNLPANNIELNLLSGNLPIPGAGLNSFLQLGGLPGETPLTIEADYVAYNGQTVSNRQKGQFILVDYNPLFPNAKQSVAQWIVSGQSGYIAGPVHFFCFGLFSGLPPCPLQ